MPENSHHDPPAHLRGLNPASVLGVLGNGRRAVRPVIAGWRIEGMAGEGGLGIVWRARREKDGQPAAIKVALAEGADTVEHIEEEASALRTLSHPHIVRLIAAGPMEGEQEGGIFLAMEYVDGLSLAHTITPEGLPPARAYGIFRRVAEAVSHAHGRGILHRDLKPGNILMAHTGTAEDHPMVADFGLARPVHQRVQHLSLTRTGLIAGTVDYLPPEAYQAGYSADVRGDIYALGVILYEMLSGGPPRGAWGPLALQKRLDIRVDGVIRRALDPDPAARWPSVAAMLGSLEEILGSPPRYAGTPLLTFPVRVGDCLWTFWGVGLFLSAGSTLARLAKSKVVWPPDLIGAHGLLTGGFHGLFFLLLASVPLALWQLWRLWHFRRVPLREALPAPFGLKLPPTRLTALLVGAAQAFCLLIPSALLLHIFISTGLSWLRPGDPPWVHGLAVTTTTSRVIHPLWQWGEPGTLYWLRETHGPPEHALSYQVDRVDFFPGSMPMAMLGAGILLGLTVVVTFAAAAVKWLGRKHRLRSWAALLPLGAYTLVAGAYYRKETLKVDEARGAQREDPWAQEQLLRKCREFGCRLLEGLPLTPEDLSQYDSAVDYRGKGLIGSGAIPELWKEETAALPAGRRLTLIKDHRFWKQASGQFRISLFTLEMVDPPEGPATAALLTLKLEGMATRDGALAIRREVLIRDVLYTAAPRPPTVEEAGAWTDAFRAALQEGSHGEEALKLLLHPRQLLWDSGRSLRWSGPGDQTRARLLSVLTNCRELAGAGPCRIIGPLAGGRTAVLIPFQDEIRSMAVNWFAELIFTEGRWVCVRLGLGETER